MAPPNSTRRASPRNLSFPRHRSMSPKRKSFWRGYERSNRRLRNRSHTMNGHIENSRFEAAGGPFNVPVAGHPLSTVRLDKLCPAKFQCYAPSATAVFLAGSFNDWDARATPLSRADDGRWVVALDLAPGFHHYKYVIDGRWVCDSGCPQVCDGTPGCDRCVPNAHGSMDRVRIVG